MELQDAEVRHRTGELRRLARQLRWERRLRPPNARPSTLRAVRTALGRGLVAMGTALLDGSGSRAPAPR